MVKKIFLFDLDKTLITCDSLKQLIFFLFKKYPKYIFFKIPSLTQIIIEHLLSNCRHRTETKSKFISKLLEGFKKVEVNNFSKQFAIYIFNNFKNKKIYEKLLNAKKITEVVYIVTASADFYCKFLARLFDVKLISTNVNLHKKNFGQLVGKNCFGDEKKLRVLSTIKNFKKKYSLFFTDSKSDLPLLRICNKGYYV
jgi:phosphoserine phosphatase